MGARLPRGYSGEEHSTLGSDILTVLQVLKLPEQVLGATQLERLRHVKPDGWYPVEWLLQLTDLLEAHVGPYGLKQLGRKLFEASHKQRVLASAKSARDIIYGMDDMYRHSNRGLGIGGFRVTKFEPGLAELEKSTPQHCLMDQGLLTEALLVVGSACNVSQASCLLKGADCCVYQITSTFADAHWSP